MSAEYKTVLFVYCISSVNVLDLFHNLLFRKVTLARQFHFLINKNSNPLYSPCNPKLEFRTYNKLLLFSNKFKGRTNGRKLSIIRGAVSPIKQH